MSDPVSEDCPTADAPVQEKQPVEEEQSVEDEQSVEEKQAAAAYIVAKCDHCMKKMRLNGKYVGKKINCPKCKEQFFVKTLEKKEKKKNEKPVTISVCVCMYVWSYDEGIYTYKQRVCVEKAHKQYVRDHRLP
jgi:hypothetical protein